MRRKTIARLEAMQHRQTLALADRQMARYVLTSVSQGAPRQMAALISVLGGTTLAVVGAAAGMWRTTDGRVPLEPLKEPLRVGSIALYAIAAVNEGGQIASDIAAAMHGNAVPITYDVTDVPHTLSTSDASSITTTNTGLTGTASEIAKLLGAGAAGAGAALTAEEVIKLIQGQQQPQQVPQGVPIGTPVPYGQQGSPFLGPPSPGTPAAKTLVPLVPPLTTGEGVAVNPTIQPGPYDVILRNASGELRRVTVPASKVANAGAEQVGAAIRGITPTGWGIVAVGAAIALALAL